MSFLDRLFGREKRAAVRSDDAYLASFFGQRAGLGAAVDPARASGLSVAHACVSSICQNLAAVPLNLYRRAEDGGRERAADHPLYGVLHDMANPNMTAFEAREVLMASVLITGNAFARIDWNGRGQVAALWPIDTGSVAVERLPSGRLRYRVSTGAASSDVLLQDEMLHLRYRLDRSGVIGLSPIAIARETFALALQQQETAAKQAANSFKPEGALVFPSPIAGQQRQQVLDQLEAKINATNGTRGVLVLDGGTDWKSFSFSARDAEFLESRKLTNLDICRVWGVPPTVVGITDHATYSNTDQESRALVVRCLAPMAKRIEQAMNAALLTADARKSLFIEHDLAGLLRGDMAARYAAYAVGRNGGWLSVNEVRAWENLPKIEGGDDYLSPLNMTAAGAEQGERGE